MAKKPVTQRQLLNRLLGRMVRGSLGRFIAITLIIMLGVMIYVGVKGIGPGYRNSAAVELQQTRLHDIEVTSTGGLTQTDLARLRAVKGVTATPVTSTFNLAESDEAVVQVYAGARHLTMDQLLVREGRLPKTRDEIVLDRRVQSYGKHRLGDTYRFKTRGDLNRRTFRIVGFVDSPRYINKTYNRGNAAIGSGSVAYFAYVTKQALTTPAYSSITLRLKTRPAGDSYSATYQQAVSAKKQAVRRALRGRATARQKELEEQAATPLAEQQAKLDAAEAQLTAAERQMTLASGGQVTSTPALAAQRASLEAARAQLARAYKQLQQQLRVQYAVNDRQDLPGFADYGDSAARIAAIGNVFPVFFFLIAALITFTTVSRMLAERRTQLGTLKALGFSPLAIARNYFLYALAAGLIGTVAGILIGMHGLTRFVLIISRTSIFTRQVILPQWGDIAVAFGMALLATIGAVLVVAPGELRVKPALLMLPKAPKNGQTILLERITAIWRRLSFHQKVTMRNLFRFKSRMAMTIIGIAGGAGLILTGFGLRDSITGTSAAQFGANGVTRYQAVVNLATAGETTRAEHILTRHSAIKGHTPVIYDVGKITHGAQRVSNVSLIAPTATDGLLANVDLSRLNQAKGQSLPSRGLLLSRKAAEVLKVTTGDEVTVTNATGEQRQVAVRGIVQNYVGHYAYMQASTYGRLWGETKTNALLVRTKAMTASARRRLAQQLLADNAAVNVSYTQDAQDMVTEMSQSMDAIVVIMIALSGMLSFIVLYNLTNINVSERMRELSTIKVLGFFDGEVTMYIMRENLILTGLGILCSFGVGRVLTQYILHQAASETVVFPCMMRWYGGVAAVLLTLTFMGIVMAVTHRHLKRVDMLEALAARE